MSDALDRLKELPAPELPPSAMDAAWSNAQRSLARRRVRRFAVRSSLVAAAVVVAALALRPASVEDDALVAHAGTTLSTSQQALESRLSDGSQVLLAAGSTLRVVSEEPRVMRVELQQGRATFEVTKNPERVFAVQAQHVEVRVVGTRFTVDVEPAGVKVDVERGAVDVASGALLKRVTAGESIFVDAPRAQLVESETVAAAEPEREPEAVAVKAPPVPKKKPVAVMPVPVAAAPTPGAAELLDAAATLRREGRFAEAAATWERYLAAWPKDSNATRIEYELGRVRMDRLHDASGAAAMLERVLAESKDPSLAEDALARLARLADGQHDVARCRELRARYAASYPAGAYAESIAALCP